VKKRAKNAPKPCKKRKSPSDDPPSIHLSQRACKRKKSAKIIPKPYRKKEERDAENEQEAAGGMGLLPEPPKPDHLQRPVPQLPARLQASFRAQIVACRKYRSKRSETWR